MRCLETELDGVLERISRVKRADPSMEKVAKMLVLQLELLEIWDIFAVVGEDVEAAEIVSDLQANIWVQA